MYVNSPSWVSHGVYKDIADHTMTETHVIMIIQKCGAFFSPKLTILFIHKVIKIKWASLENQIDPASIF